MQLIDASVKNFFEKMLSVSLDKDRDFYLKIEYLV